MSDSSALVLIEDSQQHAIVAASGPDPVEFLKAAAESGIGQHELAQIKVPGSAGITWEFEGSDGTESGQEIDLIIAFVKSGQNTFFVHEFGEGESGPPDCKSEDGVHGLGFLEEHEEDDTPQQRLCATCPKGQYGSATKGKGKACSEYAKIFGFLPGEYLPAVVSVPPTSLKALKAMRIKRLSKGQDLNAIVTRLTLTKVKASPDYSVINFSFLRNLTDDEILKSSAVKTQLELAYPPRNLWDLHTDEPVDVTVETADGVEPSDWADGGAEEPSDDDA
jgi:hypothetical protein